MSAFKAPNGRFKQSSLTGEQVRLIFSMWPSVAEKVHNFSSLMQIAPSILQSRFFYGSSAIRELITKRAVLFLSFQPHPASSQKLEELPIERSDYRTGESVSSLQGRSFIPTCGAYRFNSLKRLTTQDLKKTSRLF